MDLKDGSLLHPMTSTLSLWQIVQHGYQQYGEELIEEAIESLHSYIHDPTSNDTADETMIELIQHYLFS